MSSTAFGPHFANVTPTDFKTVVRSFALAEVQRMVDAGLPADAGAALIDGTASSSLWTNVVEWFVELRGPMLKHFQAHSTDWFAADLAVAVLGALQAGAYWRARAGSNAARTLVDLVREEPGLIIPNFKPSEMRGRPIIVAESSAGPFVMVEGSHRLSTIQAKADRYGLKALPIYVGVCPELASWVQR